MKNKLTPLRKLMLTLPDLVRQANLTDPQINLIRLVQRQKRGLLAAKLARLDCTTVQRASTQLRILVDKGYLSRSKIADESGGYVYEYHLTKYIEQLDIPQR